MHHLHRTQQLSCSLEEAWKFFSTPRNLDRLTPKSVGFKITHLTSEEMHEGQIIGYKIKVAPFIWVKWITEITLVEDQMKFIDDQRSGPYKIWHHTHQFEENEHGVLMTDDVIYTMPFGILGTLVHKLFVRRQLAHIFDERKKLCDEILS